MLFAFGVVVFFPPVVSLFDKPDLVAGVPRAYLTMFGLWAVVIGGIWLGARRSQLRGDVLVSNDGEPSQPSLNAPESPSGQNEVRRG